MSACAPGRRPAERGLTLREIGRRLRRSSLTISRELRRNQAPHEANSTQLWHTTDVGSGAAGSPQQIAGWLRMEHPEQSSFQICHETIYQAMYRGGAGGLN